MNWGNIIDSNHNSMSRLFSIWGLWTLPMHCKSELQDKIRIVLLWKKDVCYVCMNCMNACKVILLCQDVNYDYACVLLASKWVY